MAEKGVDALSRPAHQGACPQLPPLITLLRHWQYISESRRLSKKKKLNVFTCYAVDLT